MAEFAYNNSIHASTKVSPFFANYGFHPRFNISIPAISVNPLAEMRARTLQYVHRDLSLELHVARKQYKDHVDHHCLAAPLFAVDDMVWLLRHHIATTRPYANLDSKKLSPSRIIERINAFAFKLAFPLAFKIHNVFHVSLLELYHPSWIPGRQPPPPPPVELSAGEQYEVDRILDSRLRR